MVSVEDSYLSVNPLSPHVIQREEEEDSEGGVEQGGNSTIWQAAFNFTNSIVGAGIVGMPFALKECGLVLGLVFLVSVALLIDRSVNMLIETGVREGKRDFESLAGHLCGRSGFIVTLLSMFLFAFGGMCAYMIVIGDTVPAVIAASGGSISRTGAILVSSLFIVLPLCLAKDLSSLSFSSLVSVAADVLLVVLVVVGAPASAKAQGVASPPHGGYTLFSNNTFVGVGAMSFAFVCQHNSMIVFRSLKEPTVSNWQRVSAMSIGFALGLCVLFGLAGCLAFADFCKGDILNNFRPTETFLNVARGALAFTMTLTYPQELFVARHCVLQIYRYSSSGGRGLQLNDSSTSDHNLLVKSETVPAASVPGSGEDLTPASDPGCASECATHFEFYVITILLFSTTTSVALATSDLGVVLSLTGAVAASLLGYVLPPLLFLASHKGQIFKRQEQNGGGLIGLAISLFPRYSLPVGMIAFGCVACVLGVVSVFLPGGL
jgi:sodium-coupled neutral amino acid transporter 11